MEEERSVISIEGSGTDHGSDREERNPLIFIQYSELAAAR